MIVRPVIERYAEEYTSPDPPDLAWVAEDTRRSDDEAYMLVGLTGGRLLAMLVHALRPQTVLEIGTFTGYSALAMAEALPPDGQIITCEIDPDRVAAARRHVAASKWADRIDVREGPALDTIAALPGPFDFVFIDADKTGYAAYYEAVLPKLSHHGLIAADNVLHLGRVVVEDDADEDIQAIRAFNDKVRDDPRVEQVVLTVRQGMTLIRKRPDARS